MTDTIPSVERRYRDMILARPGETRLRMGCSMHATAQALVRASILAGDPQASQAVLRQALFLRFYGGEFDAAARARILVRLGRVEARHEPMELRAASDEAPAGAERPPEASERDRGRG